MRNYVSTTLHICVGLLLPFILLSCEDKMDSHYKEPAWLKGSIREVLEARGDYSLFLQGVELSGYQRILDGKSILTVMAPNDEAMKAYLTAHYQTTRMEDLSLDEVKKLIGFHILYYAFDKEKLVNFRPKEGDAATAEDKLLNAGLYYKFRTKSQDGITQEVDTAGKIVNVYHLERFVPVFSYKMFQTKQIGAKENYEYFFPQTIWTGNDGFQVSNASVIKEEGEYEVMAKNGYVYLVDQVLEPLETIYKELSDDEDFSYFLTMYNRNSEHYELDDNLTLNYGNGTELYQHYHKTASNSQPNIACEWPVTDYTQIAELAYTSYSIFAPTNGAFDDFFDSYWKIGGYDSLSQVSEESMKYLLNNCVYASSIVFPEEITKGRILSSDRSVIKFDVNAIEQRYRKMCVNGVLYGSTVLTPPAMFGSVTGPAYQYKKYSNFLRMISNSGLVSSLYSDATRYIMLYPSDEVLAAGGITYDATNNRMLNGTAALGGSAQQLYVYAHVANLDENAGIEELPVTGDCVLKSWGSDPRLYWYVKDGKITNSVRFNELLPYATNRKTEADVFSSFQELTFKDKSWSNGKAYAYDSNLFEGSFDNAIYGKFIPMMLALQTDESTLFYQFTQLLDKAGLLDIESQSVLGVEEDCLMLIPTNEAVIKAVAEGKIPGMAPDYSVTDMLSLQLYLLHYFVPLSTATISNYPYVGWKENTTPAGLPSLLSLQINLRDAGKANSKKEAVLYSGVNVFDTGSSLEIQSVGSNGPVLIVYKDETAGIDKEYEIIANGIFLTPQTAYPYLNITDDGKVLTVEIKGGERMPINGNYRYFPFVFDDGCVQFMDGVF